MSGNTLTKGSKQAKVQDVVNVKHHDGPIMLPNTMRDKFGNTDYDPAIETLMQAKAHALQTTVFAAKIDAFPWEVAMALPDVLEEVFGAATLKTKTIETFFGPVTIHPQAREIKVGPGPKDVVLVPWGAPFNIPGLPEVELNIESVPDQGRLCTGVHAEVKRKDHPVLQEIVDRVREYIKAKSIYKGKVLTLKFDTTDGADMPVIDFLDLSGFDPSILAYDDSTTNDIKFKLLAFVDHPELCIETGIKSKQSFTLAGPRGTGKTALARWVMQHGTKDGRWTAVYLQDSTDLAKALPYLARWGRSIMLAEDIDKVAGKDTPYAKVQELSLILDGLDKFDQEVLLLCTTNNLDDVHPMLRREGRLRTIPVDMPDRHAAAQVLRNYAGALLGEGQSVDAAGKLLAGYPPATCEAVVGDAKRVYIARTGSLDFKLTGEDLRVAAEGVIRERGYCHRSDQTPRSKDELFGYELGKGMAQGIELGVRLALKPKDDMDGLEFTEEEEREFTRLITAGLGGGSPFEE